MTIIEALSCYCMGCVSVDICVVFPPEAVQQAPAMGNRNRKSSNGAWMAVQIIRCALH